jgi:hypothetical protein
MNRLEAHNTEEANVVIDRLLASEPELAPSSGFLAAVMESIRDEAAAPPQIAFPWKRVLPGAVVIAGLVAWSGYEASHWLAPALREWITNPAPIQLNLAHLTGPVSGIAFAAGVALLSWLISARLIRRA